jgi:hypothetical protein
MACNSVSVTEQGTNINAYACHCHRDCVLGNGCAEIFRKQFCKGFLSSSGSIIELDAQSANARMSKICFFALDATKSEEKVTSRSNTNSQPHPQVQMELRGLADELFDIISNIVLIGSLARNVGIEAEGITVVPEKHFATEIFHFSPICCCFFEDLMDMDYKHSKTLKLCNTTYNDVHIAILNILCRQRENDEQII